jgi:hypothetical protein
MEITRPNKAALFLSKDGRAIFFVYTLRINRAVAYQSLSCPTLIAPSPSQQPLLYDNSPPLLQRSKFNSGIRIALLKNK